MKKEDILLLLRQKNILKDIDNGPTAVMVMTRGRKSALIITKSGDYIKVKSGHFLKLTRKFLISEILEDI